MFYNYVPIVVASQTVENNEDEKELLNRWINVVEYEKCRIPLDFSRGYRLKGIK